MKVALGGGTPVTIASRPNSYPTGLAIDARCVYWVDLYGGTVMTANK